MKYLILNIGDYNEPNSIVGTAGMTTTQVE